MLVRILFSSVSHSNILLWRFSHTDVSLLDFLLPGFIIIVFHSVRETPVAWLFAVKLIGVRLLLSISLVSGFMSSEFFSVSILNDTFILSVGCQKRHLSLDFFLLNDFLSYVFFCIFFLPSHFSLTYYSSKNFTAKFFSN